MTHRFSFFCVFALVFFAGFSPFVFSQENISVDVTAEKLTEEVSLESSTTTVITADEIAESGASSVVEILENVPGIMFRSPIYGPGSEEITMRGFGANSFGRVLVLVDGNRLNNPDMKGLNWNSISLFDIERIEILDGSASVQYGNYAVAGVINIITKKSGKTQTNINLSAGSFWNNSEAISHQRSTDWGRFSLSAEHIGSEGFRKRSAYDTTNAALNGTIDFNEQLSLSLKGTFADLHYEMPGGIPETEYKKNPQTALNLNDEASEHHVSSGAELEWFLSDAIELNIPVLYRGTFAEIDMYSFSNRSTNSAEAHPTANFAFDINDMLLHLTFGIDVHFAALEIKTYQNAARKGQSAKMNVDIFNTGYFFTAIFDPLETLSFNIGARHDIFNLDFKSDDKNHQAFAYEVGAAFKPINQLNLYAKYSTLFRFPFSDEIVEQNMTSGKFSINKNVNPEKGFNVEGGINFAFNKWIDVNANLFFMQLEDEIDYYDEDGYMGPIEGHNKNLDPTQRIGTNITVTSEPLDFLKLEGSYSYVNAEFTDGANKGNMIPLVSEHEVSGAITFKLPLNFQVGIDLDYRGESYRSGDLSNTDKKIDDYFLLGASLSYSLDKDTQHWAFLLQAKNLLDTKYSPFVFSGGTFYPANGREFNLSIQYRF